MFAVESPIQAGFHCRDPPARIGVGQAQRARHPVHLFPGGEGQHPIGILPQFRQCVAGPDLSNLVGQMEIKTVVIEKRNNPGLLGYGAPRLHQFLSAFCREHPGEFLHVPLAQHCAEILSELLPQSPGLGSSDSESVEYRMPHEEIDDQPATGRSQGCLFDMDLVAVYRVATAHALQRQTSPTMGTRKMRSRSATKRMCLPATSCPVKMAPPVLPG
jgi:hypothetical protein